MLEDWLSRWREGQIGWHEAAGNALLKRYWPRLVRDSSVLVPFCGKAVDMLWLASQGLKVTGVEVSEVAVRTFFAENALEYRLTEHGSMPCYEANSAPVRILQGDYFEVESEPFHALYDRGALVALPPDRRPDYVAHTRKLLREDAYRLIITMSYDDSQVSGPPYRVDADELQSYWGDLDCVSSRDALDQAPQKFRRAGVTRVVESVWIPG